MNDRCPDCNPALEPLCGTLGCALVRRAPSVSVGEAPPTGGEALSPGASPKPRGGHIHAIRNALTPISLALCELAEGGTLPAEVVGDARAAMRRVLSLLDAAALDLAAVEGLRARIADLEDSASDEPITGHVGADHV